MKNQLKNSNNPYLLQHADNPVNWHLWKNETFEKAKKLNKPIFLSIGYSTCHWCHIMEKESFNDKETAEILNEIFIPIKLDREERPDLDNYYMKICQTLTGSGGWPLTIIMTPDKKPFFAGTYIPKHTFYNRIGLIELSKRIDNLWKNENENIIKNAQQVFTAVNQTINRKKYKLDESIVSVIENELKKSFDEKHGGFGNAPKFPMFHNLLFLMKNNPEDPETEKIVSKTLLEMYSGGIYDFLGGGFHRYSTDKKWKLPHFEKMLYDQAMALLTYSKAFENYKKKEYLRTAEDIFKYLAREMLSEKGGFYSAQDADSENEEGLFYIWTYEELKEVLTENELETVKTLFNIEPEGNFIQEHSLKTTRKNILFSSPENVKTVQTNRDIKKIRKKLFNVREKRIKPFKDEKILTDWNGLLLAGVSYLYRVSGKEKYLKTGEKLASFLLDNLFKDGVLYHRYINGDTDISGFLDDYSFLIFGLINLYEASLNHKYFKSAENLLKIMIDKFYDSEGGGFYFSSKDSESDFNEKRGFDGAIPSGSSIAVYNLVKIGFYISDNSYLEKAKAALDYFSLEIENYPTGFSFMLKSFLLLREEKYRVIISAESRTEEVRNFINDIQEKYREKIHLIILESDDSENIKNLYQIKEDYPMIDNNAYVYICTEDRCKEPFKLSKGITWHLIDL